VEPSPGLEPGTCRLRNRCFSPIPLLLYHSQQPPFGLFRGGSGPILQRGLQRGKVPTGHLEKRLLMATEPHLPAVPQDKRVGYLLKLAEDAWKCMDSRRTYEWKVAFGIWTALAAFSGLVFRGEVRVSTLGIVLAWAFFSVLWYVFTFVWSKGLYVRNKFDRDLAEHYWILAEASLGPDARSLRAKKRIEHQYDNMWANWAHRTQITVTTIFVLLAIVSMLFGGAPHPIPCADS
jgi:hypothetical protein